MRAMVIGVSMAFDSSPDRRFKAGYPLEFQNSAYAALIARYGGIPVFMPLWALEGLPELLQRLDGVLLTGGADLVSEACDDSIMGRSTTDQDQSRRSRFEHEVIQESLRKRIPVLGICRGLQQLNVSLGGSLWEDLDKDLGIGGHHRVDRPHDRVHEVSCESGCALLPEGIPAKFRVTSTHHQAISLLAEDLCVLARASEHPTVIEAVRLCDPQRFMLGVQWHPERIPDDSSSKAVMRDFLFAVSQRCESRERRNG